MALCLNIATGLNHSRLLSGAEHSLGGRLLKAVQSRLPMRWPTLNTLVGVDEPRRFPYHAWRLAARDGQHIGVIALCRSAVEFFTDKQIELVETFADQAVIAIENVRLFEEVQARTRDLSKSLQQQTATADVLKVISRSTFDLQTVLQTLVESAARFCDADKASIIREKDGAFYAAEAYGYSREYLDYIKHIPIKAERGSASGRALVEGRVVHITDAAADRNIHWSKREIGRLPYNSVRPNVARGRPDRPSRLNALGSAGIH